MKTKYHYISNGDGWHLEIKHCQPQNKTRKLRPVLIIPGYGMNSFIFGYHPTGLSMEEYLTEHGFEVWSANLRGQGGAICKGGSRRYGMKELAFTDLTAAIEYVAKNTVTGKSQVDLIGCSLGGTLAYLHVSFVPKNRVGTIAALGAPLRWEEIHPLLKVLFFSPRLVGMIPMAHTRKAVRKVIPHMLKFPKLLEMYLHADIVNTSNMHKMLETVETPSRFINQEIGYWMKSKDMMVDGKNLTVRFGRVKKNLICILANSDGVVPMPTALSAYENIGTPDKHKEILVVGTEDLRFAHADLFVSDFSQQMVFEPLAAHLKKMN